MHTVVARQKGKFSFEIQQEGFSYVVDASPGAGEGKGPTPKGLLLGALAGCTGMDVVDVLRKMRMSYDSFDIQVRAEVASEDPKVYTSILLIYRLAGKEAEPDKVARAVRLSQEKYCGVSAMLRASCPIHIEIWVNDREVAYPGAA